MTPDFVVFLANVTRYLVPDRQGEETYTWQTPLQAGRHVDWTRVAGAPPPDGADTSLPWPGLYKDSTGELHAINLLGLAAAQPKLPPDQALAAAPLPEPQEFSSTLALWPFLVCSAMVLWLLGWTLRLPKTMKSPSPLPRAPGGAFQFLVLLVVVLS